MTFAVSKDYPGWCVGRRMSVQIRNNKMGIIHRNQVVINNRESEIYSYRFSRGLEENLNTLSLQIR
jgi:hypothetical protein